MLPRFLVPDLDSSRREISLPAPEAHHLARVLRLGAGAEVRIFDGRGLEFLARVTAVDRTGVTVALVRRIDSLREPRVALTLVQSVLKGPAMNDVIRDCTMAGARAIQPVVSQHTTVAAAALPAAAERWQRVALAATKQCGRPRLPEIREPMKVNAWLRAGSERVRYILLEPSAAVARMKTLRAIAQDPPPESAALLVGPEGGWSVEERQSAIESGCTPLTLGSLTLRADAVPFAATVALLAIWEREGTAVPEITEIADITEITEVTEGTDPKTE